MNKTKPNKNRNGKGDRPRPFSVSREEFNKEFDRIFKEKKREDKKRVRKQ
jgi:hypothetical protein